MRWWWCRQGPTPVLGICVALFCLCFIVLFLGGGGGHGGKHQLGAGYLIFVFLLFCGPGWAVVAMVVVNKQSTGKSTGRCWVPDFLLFVSGFLLLFSSCSGWWWWWTNPAGYWHLSFLFSFLRFSFSASGWWWWWW